MKIFFILSRIPYPLDKGDKLRAFHQIKELSKHHDIHLLAINDATFHPNALEELKPYCKSVKFIKLGKITILRNLISAFFSGLPMQVGYFYNKALKKIILEDIAKRKPDLIYCQLIRTAEFVRGIKDIPKLLDYMDVFSKGVERRIEKVPFYLKPIFRMEYHRLLKYEHEVFDDFTYKTIISEQDRALIPHADNEKISIIPNGVDMEYFKPIDIEKKYDILFSGNMSYPPNVDSAVYIVEKILPLIVKHFPHIKILIAGASPTSKVLSLKSENVEVMGWVDDISMCFAESRMLVAPMQLSIGLQNKLLQAMAMKMPVVTSVLANNALHARPGKEILVANTPEEYAVHIITLLNEKSKAEAIAENGYRFIKVKYTWVAMDELLNKIIT